MNLVLHAAKRSGLFSLTQWMYRKRLNILCFHGFSLQHEHAFRPKLFMTSETFAARLSYLQHNKFNVLTLDQALLRLDRGESQIKDIVITIDDGFFSVLKIAAPMLKAYDYPATLYITSYYSKYPHPVYRLAVQYMFWRTAVPDIDLDALICKPENDTKASSASKLLIDDTLCEWLIVYGERELDEDSRMDLLKKIGKLLGVSIDDLSSSRCFSLLSAEEISQLTTYGIDVQLHTHRHRFPLDEVKLIEEIQKNRDYLMTCSDSRLKHFCYPSGEWHQNLWPALKAARIISATTCDSGLNHSKTPRLALHRFLDGEHLSDIQFEAEITGFKQLLRDMRAALNHIRLSAVSLTMIERHLADRYGGKKAWLLSIGHRMIATVKPQPRANQVKTDYNRLVFACKGNICRSPYAEAKVRQAGFATASFGLDATTGTRANPFAARVAESRHVNLSRHEATHINDFQFLPGDLVLAFEPSQLAALQRPGVLPESVSANLLGLWCHPKFPYLHDPYGLGDIYLNTCFDRIDAALAHLLNAISVTLATN